MAKMSVNGLDDLMLSLEEIAEIPEDVVAAMLDAEAEIVAPEIRKEAAKLGMYSGYDTHGNSRDTTPDNTLLGQERSYSTGELARSVKVGKMKTKNAQRQKYIYFSGSRKRGKSRVKNSEIAFLNEYGTRTINARNFIWVAIERVKDQAVKASAKVYDEFLKSKNL